MGFEIRSGWTQKPPLALYKYVLLSQTQFPHCEIRRVSFFCRVIRVVRSQMGSYELSLYVKFTSQLKFSKPLIVQKRHI